MYKGKNILVAGGTGLVGSNLTKRLLELNADVLATYYLKKPVAYEKHHKKFDFTNFEDCLEATKDMEYVIICAAQSFGAKMMKENPTGFILPNLKIYAGLLEACNVNKTEKVILISSSTVYQNASYPISEDALDLNTPPFELYFGIGWLNRYFEQLASFYYKTKGMKIGIIRPTSIYGPYDKFDEEKSNVLPAIIKRALKKEDPFIVWGDGSAIRDFLYVEDFIDDLMEILDKYCICDPINVGFGKGIDIRTSVETVLEVCGHKVVPQYDKTKPTAVPYRVLNLEKYQSVFGKKKRTPLREGIKKTVEWYLSEVGLRNKSENQKI